jgi:hypothetical protein
MFFLIVLYLILLQIINKNHMAISGILEYNCLENIVFTPNLLIGGSFFGANQLSCGEPTGAVE